MPPPTRPQATPSASDIATNEALLAHAEAARLAKSWLATAFPPSVDGAQGNADDGEEEHDSATEEATLRAHRDLYSETSGIGYHPPPDGPTSAGTLSRAAADPATAFLRKQLLGRGHAHNKHPGAVRTATFASTHRSSTARPLRARRKESDDEDRDESRSGLVKSKSQSKNKTTNSREPARGTAADMEGSEMGGGTPRHSNLEPEPPASDASQGRAHATATSTSLTPSHAARTQKRGTSYLDELLASRAAKKNKKTNKKKQKSVDGSERG